MGELNITYMKRKIKQLLFVSLLFLLSNTSIAQLRFDYPIETIEEAEQQAIYSLFYVQDTTNLNDIRHENMLLLLGRTTSLFTSLAKFEFDTQMRKISNSTQFQEFLLSGNVPSTTFSYRIIKNYPKGNLTFIDHIPSDTYKFEEKLDMFKWKLTNDTATISGYKVQKAFCNFGGRSWIAWFSLEIPYSDGPYKFNGLPGLIIKISDSQDQYVFELTSFSSAPEDTNIDFTIKTFIETTKQGYFQAKDGFRDDIVSRAAQAGMNSDSQQKIGQKMRSRNNPIELRRQ